MDKRPTPCPPYEGGSRYIKRDDGIVHTALLPQGGGWEGAGFSVEDYLHGVGFGTPEAEAGGLGGVCHLLYGGGGYGP